MIPNTFLKLYCNSAGPKNHSVLTYLMLTATNFRYVIFPESQTESADDLGLQMGSSVSHIHTIDENRGKSFTRVLEEEKKHTNLPEYDETQSDNVFFDGQSDNA